MSGGRVVVGGAINTDLVARADRAPERGETVTGDGFAVLPGGKGANQAVAAARSGAAVAMVGGLGDDAFGDDRLAELRAEGIDTAAVVRVAGAASGVALITVEAEGDNRILYVPGATRLVGPEAADDLGDGPVGVLALTLELAPPVVDALVARARRDGGTVVLNATPEPEGARRLLRSVDVLVVNETEALALAGRVAPGPDPDWEAVAARLRAVGPSAVVVTLGAAGALVATVQGSERVSAPTVEVVDTTGAGDALCGALAAGLAAGLPLVEAVRRGVAAGSLACTGPGARSAVPGAEEIDRALSALGGRASTPA